MARAKRGGATAASAEDAVDGSVTAEVESYRTSSLFGPGADNVVRGELVVKLSVQARDAATSSIPTAPLGALWSGIPSVFGLPEVDAVLQRYGPRSVSRMHPPVSEAAAPSALDVALGSTFLVRLADAADVAEAAGALSALSAVEVAEPNRWREACVVPDDPRFPEQWGLARIQAPAAWSVTTGSPSVVVAVIDSGVDLDHPDLAPLLLPGKDLVDLAGTSPPPGTHYEGDWTGRDSEPQDEVGHGTHVAGTIACVGNNGIGVAGVTWCTSILPVRVLARVVDNAAPNRVRGVGSAVDIAAGIRWAVDHGARVLNLSLGGYSDTFVERDAIAYAVSRGAVVVAAMGNDDDTEPSYPAAYPGVIAVGATDASDRRAPFSNRGPHLCVVAPGVDVLSTAWNDTYAVKSGTSMATPHVAGVAALLLAVRPDLKADEVRALIVQGAAPLREADADPVPNDQFGAGLVDAAASLAHAFAAPAETAPPFPTFARPTMPFPTLPVFPTRATFPTLPTRPTLTFPTRPTLPTFPTRPTVPTRPTLTFPTRPTLPTFPTRPTAPTRPTLTFPTRPTAPTFPTRPTFTAPTRPTFTAPTRPTFTAPTRPTFTFPTRPTFTAPTRPTFTAPTRPTFTFPTRPTLTFPTRPTLPTRPTAPTFPTRPTLTFPTRPTLQTFPTRATVTFPTRPPITFGPGPGPINAGEFDYDPYGGAAAGYGDPYGGADYGQGYDEYGGGDYGAYGAYDDPYAGAGYDPYGAGASGYEAAYDDPSAAYGWGDAGYGYADPYGGGAGYESYDPYAGWAAEGGADPYGGAAPNGYPDPYAGYYDPYAGQYGAYDPGYGNGGSY